jgi:hypothetical protein
MLGSVSPAGLVTVLYNKATQAIYPEEWGFLAKVSNMEVKKSEMIPLAP